MPYDTTYCRKTPGLFQAGGPGRVSIRSRTPDGFPPGAGAGGAKPPVRTPKESHTLLAQTSEPFSMAETVWLCVASIMSL